MHLPQVPDMGAEDTNIAIETAHSAQYNWAALTCKVISLLVQYCMQI